MGRGRMGKGRDNNLITRSYTAQESQIERGGTVGHRDGYPTPDILLERFLEGPDPSRIGQVTVFHHLGGGFLLRVSETGLAEADGYGH